MFAIEDRGLILDAALQPPQGRIAYFTSLCMLRSGTILCGCQYGPGKHAPTSTVRLSRSVDQGRTWELLPCEFETRIDGAPGSIGAAELVEAAPGRLLLFATWFDRTDPDRPLFDPVTEGILRTKQLLSVSSDEGRTWSGWRALSMGDLKGCALTGPIVQWADGAIAFAFESFKEYDDPRPGRHAAWITVSRDGGESFSPPMLVAQHPEHKIYYWDQRLCAGTRPGEFTALFWTHDLAEKRDLDVHLQHGRLTGDAIATTPISATKIPGQIAAPCRLDDGRLTAFVVDRDQIGTMTLWCSSDDGKTWPASDRLVVYTHDERAAISQGRENVDFKQYWEDMGKWSFGHPAVRRLADGRLLLAWYAGTPDCMSLHWVARPRRRKGHAMKDWIVTQQDRELFDRELDSFVPQNIFDAHAHWYRADHFPADATPVLVNSGPAVAGSEAFDDAIGQLIPNRRTEGLFFPFPHAAVDVDAPNEFLHQELLRRPASRGQMLITPGQDAEFIRETVRKCRFVGLKCYHVYSPRRPTFESLIEEYLPESHVRVAHDEGLSITLHMVRARALADVANQETIRRYCERYPNMRLILAHAARGFNPHHTILGIASLRGLNNVWFDTSAVTDSGAVEAIVNTLGHTRVLYGSDFPVSHLRGRCVALGDSFFWISSDNTNLDVPYAKLDLALVGHESLRMLKVAAMSLRLTDSQIEDIFYRNATRLFGLDDTA